MSLRYNIATFSAKASSFILKKILRRPGGFFPGDIALKVDNNLLSELVQIFDLGTVLVTGTNGKTSVTALVADCMRYEGAEVAWNKTGANLASGVATAIMAFKSKKRKNRFGVFEIDELWVAKVLPELKSKYLLLLDLFPDQVDRFGSINNIQKSLVEALNNSPETVLVYNADDPNCQVVADDCKNNTIAFGAEEKISKTKDSSINKCPLCHFNLNYSLHQYAQLGNYRCPSCGFNRARLKFAATDIRLNSEKLEFRIGKEKYVSMKPAEYVCYNLTGFIALAKSLGCHEQSINRAIKFQKSENGRMQYFDIEDKKVMINLAKNPVGFNQNINFILDSFLSNKRPSNTSVAFFANAREGDGKNTSWLHQVDFDKLRGVSNLNIYYGGEASSELAKALKSKNIVAHRVENATDLLNSANHSKQIYIVANYTAMFPLRDELIKMSKKM